MPGLLRGDIDKCIVKFDPEITIRVYTDNWEADSCPVRAVMSVSRRGFALYEITIDKTIYPCPENERLYIHWNDIAKLLVGGLEISDQIKSEVGQIAECKHES